VFAIAERDSGPLTPEQERATGFPIRRTAPHPNERKPWGSIVHTSDRAQSTIRQLQPFVAFATSPGDSPLSHLAELSETSKHRRRIVYAAAIGFEPVAFRDGYIDHLHLGGGRLEPGQELHLVTQSAHNNADFDARATIHFHFDLPGSVLDGTDAVKVVEAMYRYVDSPVIDRLLPRLFDRHR
jgi:hypothetical protein